MYNVEIRFGNQWVVVDADGQTMCAGTMRECEGWLDGRENLPATITASRRQVAAVVPSALIPIAVDR